MQKQLIVFLFSTAPLHYFLSLFHFPYVCFFFAFCVRAWLNSILIFPVNQLSTVVCFNWHDDGRKQESSKTNVAEESMVVSVVVVLVPWRLISISCSKFTMPLTVVVTFAVSLFPPMSLPCFVLFIGYLLSRGSNTPCLCFALRSFLNKSPSTFQSFFTFTFLPGSSALLQTPEFLNTTLPNKVQWSALFLLITIGSSYLKPTPCFCPLFCLCRFF